MDAADGEAVTQGGAALLLCRLLGMETAQGKPFYEGLCASGVQNAVLLDSDAISGGGPPHTALVYRNAAVVNLLQTDGLPEALVGERGTLLLDQAGRAVGFPPDGNARETVTAASADAAGLNGLAVAGSTAVLPDGEKTNWESCWFDLKEGDEVVVYRDAAGQIDLLWVKDPAAGAAVTVTGFYEDASPSAAAPEAVTIPGASFHVTDQGLAALKGYTTGARITLTPDRAGRVTDARDAGNAAMAGMLKSASAGRAEAEPLSNITVSGAVSGSISSTLTGNLVKVFSPAAGKLSVSALSYTPGSLAGKELADDLRVFEQAGGSTPAELAADHVDFEALSDGDILHLGTDSAGRVNLLVLNNVTGACYAYGILREGEQTGGTGEMKYTNRTVAVENAGGTGKALVTGWAFQDGAVGGAAASGDGKAASVVVLEALEGLSRADFTGSGGVGGYPIAEDVQAYNSVTGKWTTLAALKAFTNRFTAYYDGLGVVRVIFGE